MDIAAVDFARSRRRAVMGPVLFGLKSNIRRRFDIFDMAEAGRQIGVSKYENVSVQFCLWSFCSSPNHLRFGIRRPQNFLQSTSHGKVKETP